MNVKRNISINYFYNSGLFKIEFFFDRYFCSGVARDELCLA